MQPTQFCHSVRERPRRSRYSDATVATKTKRTGQDRKRVSEQKHEVQHTGGKVAESVGTTTQKGKHAVTRAKKETRSVSRGKVEERAKKIAE